MLHASRAILMIRVVISSLVLQDATSPSSWSRCQQWHIPCHIRPRPTPAQPPSPITPAQSSSRQSPSPAHQFSTLHHSHQLSSSQQQHSAEDSLAAGQLSPPQVVNLDVSACAVLPMLAVQGEGTSWQPDHGVWELNYGRVINRFLFATLLLHVTQNISNDIICNIYE